MADKEDRKEITREQYFSSLDPQMSSETRSVIENLIKWSHDNYLIEKFTTGERDPAFTPLMGRPEKARRTFYVQADGWIVIPIRWMNDRQPFTDPEKCQEIVSRIEDMPGAVVTDKANDGFPKFPTATLTSPDQFNEFIDVLSWIIDEIKEADDGSLGAGRSIWVFGNPDKSEVGFPTAEDLTKYIQGGIFTGEQGHYRHTLIRNADVIVLSRDGMAFGHFEIRRREKPSDSDLKEYAPVRSTYIVRSSFSYKHRVALADLQITKLKYGRKLSEGEFQELLKQADGVQEYRNICPIPEEILSPAKYFEGAVTTATVNAYERNSNARQACLQHYGYDCAVCGFSMAELYGENGDNVIHVHHLHELSTIGKEYQVDPIHDLRPVCPNCHAILHTESPAMTIEKLQKFLSERKPIQWPSAMGKH